MELYVKIHGLDSYDNLRFKPGTSGGSGRGPVDLYNQLVDILRILKTRAEQAGQPVSIAPCYKFLAKDIMAWNDAWGDDAFSPGRVPGWEGWLKNRRSMGVLPSLVHRVNMQSSDAEPSVESSDRRFKQARMAQWSI
ncbi:hypothetical protein WJX74_010788 [Apatococcus lobatus]|uniref:Uncharacterized protein n=1 Tax=Apatococcus lobatus TaxID=904363 RepID=A0AAW1QVK2_9CHLO